jgi:hypothetical protein
MEIPKDLRTDIYLYCKANNIMDYDTFMIKCMRQGFTIEKFGVAPQIGDKKVETISVEPVVESISEPKIEEVKVPEKKKNQKPNTNIYGE